MESRRGSQSESEDFEGFGESGWGTKGGPMFTTPNKAYFGGGHTNDPETEIRLTQVIEELMVEKLHMKKEVKKLQGELLDRSKLAKKSLGSGGQFKGHMIVNQVGGGGSASTSMQNSPVKKLTRRSVSTKHLLRDNFLELKEDNPAESPNHRSLQRRYDQTARDLDSKMQELSDARMRIESLELELVFAKAETKKQQEERAMRSAEGRRGSTPQNVGSQVREDNAATDLRIPVPIAAVATGVPELVQQPGAPPEPTSSGKEFRLPPIESPPKRGLFMDSPPKSREGRNPAPDVFLTPMASWTPRENEWTERLRIQQELAEDLATSLKLQKQEADDRTAAVRKLGKKVFRTLVATQSKEAGILAIEHAFTSWRNLVASRRQAARLIEVEATAAKASAAEKSARSEVEETRRELRRIDEKYASEVAYLRQQLEKVELSEKQARVEASASATKVVESSKLLVESNEKAVASAKEAAASEAKAAEVAEKCASEIEGLRQQVVEETATRKKSEEELLAMQAARQRIEEELEEMRAARQKSEEELEEMRNRYNQLLKLMDSSSNELSETKRIAREQTLLKEIAALKKERGMA
ncbi:unnamed protein product [Amoebophrya sp. A25]|nr:unnamed protein product [Amoebophrya sp. A25]|eukprot:GSA25T00014106001.1